MGVFEPLQKTRGKPTPDTNRPDPKSDREPAYDGPGSSGRGGGRTVEHPQDLTGTVDEDATGRRERDPAAVTFKQLDPKRFLQLTDLRAQNLLRDVDPASRCRETGFLGDSHKVAEVPHLDVHHGRMLPTAPEWS
jgi:hypothetical protein